MPVPTYVPTRGAGHGSAVVQGWNCPPSPPTPVDDVPPNLEYIQHHGDSDLYDRPDWPLPSPQPKQSFMDGPEELDAHLEQPAPHVPSTSEPDRFQGRQLDGTAYLGEPDVSDIEEVSEEEDADEQDEKAGSHTDKEQEHEDEEDTDDDDDEEEEVHTGTATVAQRLNCRHSLRRPSDYSTHRQNASLSDRSSISGPTDRSISPINEAPPENLRPEGPSSISHTNSDQETRLSTEHQEQTVETQDASILAEEQLQPSNADIAHLDPGSPIPPQATISIPSSSPQPNGILSRHSDHPDTLSADAASSSPSQWRMSVHSPHQTTQIPHNQDRVRYSWQSLHHDEPNRPRIHIIKLVSNTATASAGFPQGEAFAFSISPKGRRIAAYNSARLFVLQTAALPMGVSQDYALKRRPLAVELTDEGRVMAVLADDHTVNVYQLGPERMRLDRTITLDFPAACIALAPTGGLLAASYEGGIEIFSLDPSALSTDRRAVRAIRMDRMMFSDDGSTLLGTTTRIHASSTVTVSVPIFPSAPSGIPTSEELKEAWCAELLHPENIRHSSHATFLRENHAPSNDRLFAWNGLEDTFGILNVSGMQYENIDFPVVISPPLSTCGGLGAAIHSCPAIDEQGGTVAMIVNDRTVRLYVIPSKGGDDEASVEAHSIDHELDEGYGCPFSEVRWVHGASALSENLEKPIQAKGRLIVTSPGGVMDHSIPEESIEDIEGGRIILFDFDPAFTGRPGQTFTLTLGKSPPQLLEEAQVDVEQAVALMRRRTVNQNKNTSLSQRPVTLGRSATMMGNHRLSRADGPVLRPNPSRMSMLSVGSLHSDATRSLPDLLETTTEPVQAVEEPYAQNAPRSQALLQRAATNAQRHRYQALEERTQETVNADATTGFLTLPEYTEEPNAPLPSRFRAMAGLDLPTRFSPSRPGIATDVGDARESPTSSGSRTAPPEIGERFSADETFRIANLRTVEPPDSEDVAPDHIPPRPQSGAPSSPMAPSLDFTARSHVAMPEPPQRQSVTFQPLQSMPRGLQRAYNNAGYSEIPRPSSIAGGWVNVSSAGPAAFPEGSSFGNGGGAPSASLTAAASAVPEDSTWDMVSPVEGGIHTPSPNSRAQRYSSSLLNPPMQPPSTASSMAPSVAASWQSTASSRRAPPYATPVRRSAANPSVFPSNHAADHVPLRQPMPSSSSAGHRITAWHPPAPSGSSHHHLPPQRSGSGKSHSRRSSRTSKGAFASTAKAKRLGFFKRTPKHDPYGRPTRGRAEDGSMFETKSMMTWMTRSDKCVLM